MLVKIQCDKFISHGKVREPITFHSGLNTILGGKSADNSIGKSTFLLIIDYVFGGDTYKNSDAVRHLGNHTINFAFKFNDVTYYFCRDMVNSSTVGVCDKNYNIKKTVEIDDFRKFLFTSYNINLPSVSFRDVISRYFRIYGKENYSEIKPLNSYTKESGEKAIIALEKLFNVYSKIESFKIAESETKEMKRIFTNARKHEFVSGTVTKKTQFEANEKKIEELEIELIKIMDQADKDLSIEDLSHAEEAAEIKGKITSIKRKRGRLLSELNIVKINMEGGLVPSKANLDELCHFFPNANLKKIEEIEKFHYHIQEILKDEFLEETKRLNFLIDAANTEILKLEENIRKLDIPAKLSKSFLDKYSALESQINDLKTQNKAYIYFNIIAAHVKTASENLKAIQDRELRCIESIVNYQMRFYNDFIYDAKRKSPFIYLDEGKKYSFQTPDDTGTGTSYKSLIIFDLSILKLTCLPAIAHDSLVFKNIGDAPISKIMELYMESDKQIFISFDKEVSYSESTRKILNDTAVLYLNEGGDELFGCSWNKK